MFAQGLHICVSGSRSALNVDMVLTSFSQVEVLIFWRILEDEHRASHWVVVCACNAHTAL